MADDSNVEVIVFWSSAKFNSAYMLVWIPRGAYCKYCVFRDISNATPITKLDASDTFVCLASRHCRRRSSSVYDINNSLVRD